MTVAMEDSPRDLEAMDYGDDVHLMWTEPIDASSFELAYDDGVVAKAYWYGGAVAVRFRVSGTYGVNGLANSVWTGGWPDAFLGETPFTLSVLALDTETDMPGDTLFAQEVLVDADPTSETYGWAMIEMEETLVVTGDVFVMYSDFGFDFDAGAPGPDMDMMTKISDLSGGIQSVVAFDLIAKCIDQIYDEENVYNKTDRTPDELQEFLERLTPDQFKKIEHFFNTIPKMYKDIEFKCGSCGHIEEIKLEGLASFFG